MRLRHIIIYVGMWAMFLLLMFLTSCKSGTVGFDRQVRWENFSNVTDTIQLRHFLEAFERMERVRGESRSREYVEKSHVRDSTSTIVDESGRVIGREHYHYENNDRSIKEATRLTDSIRMLNARYDSIYSLKHRSDSLLKSFSDSTQVTAEAKLSSSERIYMAVGKIFCSICHVAVVLLFLAIMAYLYVKFSKWRKNNGKQ